MALISMTNGYLQSPKLNFILFQISLYFFLLVPPATSLSFNFTGFNNSNGIIMLAEDAQIKYRPDIIDLTLNTEEIPRPKNIGTGRALYNAPVQLWDNKTGSLTNFTSHFFFTITNSMTGSRISSGYGDGLTFFLAPYGSEIHTYGGGGLGVFNDTVTNMTNRIVAMEFDTYQNGWDPDSYHVGIDIYSVISVKNISGNSSFWNWMRDNASPWEASVSYDSSSFNLSVVLTCANKSVSYCEFYSLSHIIDLREYLPEKVHVGFSAATGWNYELHQLNSWNFSSSLDIGNSNNNTRMMVGLVVGGAAMITVLGLFWFCWLWRKNKKRKADDDMALDVPTGPREFSYDELARATNNFDEKQKLGEGGFGGVYRGFLNDVKMDVAVKRISEGSKQGKKEYRSEVKIISRLRHRNLVQLVGWCHQQNELLLVYEFMPNGSLDVHLFQNRGSLTWELRYKIALDLASALQYLHEGWEQCIVHRDIKSSNIILDSNFHAKLGDFGLARLVEHEKGLQITNVAGTMGCIPVEQEKAGSMQTTNVAGTTGYMAPEYCDAGKASKESDVYSFGIVLLEIACGRKAIEMSADRSEVSLVRWVWELYGSRKHLEAADSSQDIDFDKQQIECMIVVGLWCAQHDYNLRPSIGEAINVLKFNAPLPILPLNMSTFSITSSRSTTECNTSLTKCSPKSCPNIDSAKLDKSSISASSAASLLQNTW